MRHILSNDTLELESYTMPAYSTLFAYEGNFDLGRAKHWMEKYWVFSVYGTGLYLLIVFGGKYWMKNRPAFDLRQVLALWNFVLAAFSIIGTYRMVPETLYVLNRPNGFHHSVCFPTYRHNSVWSFWAWAFVISKVPELGDTIFIVLRKQRLIFLHWYHHITVLLYCWYTYQEYVAPARWYIVLNFTVHSCMYSYYCLKALGYRVPKVVAFLITSLQLIQMLVGVIVNVHARQAKRRGLECDVSDTNINLCLTMYSSYFLLFAIFFYKSYLAKAEPKSISKVVKKIE